MVAAISQRFQQGTHYKDALQVLEEQKNDKTKVAGEAMARP